MPVRKIPRNHIHVTGRHATSKSEDSADFESLLEKEHLLLLDHDPLVQSYEVQPVLIPVPGVPRGYTPDLLVHYALDEDGCIPQVRFVKSKSQRTSNETPKNTLQSSKLLRGTPPIVAGCFARSTKQRFAFQSLEI